MPRVDGFVNYDLVGNAAALTFQPSVANEPGATQSKTIDAMALNNLAFLKIDTQGGDLHVLRGARHTIERCRPVIATEYERELAQGHGDTLEDYMGFFDRLGYRVSEMSNKDGKQIDLLAVPE